MIPTPYLLTQNTCNGVRLWGDSERFSLAEAEEQRGVVSFFPLAQQAGWIFSVQVSFAINQLKEDGRIQGTLSFGLFCR